MLAFGAAGMQFNLHAGAEARVLELRTTQRKWGVGTPICFEDTVAGLCRRMTYETGKKRLDVFVNVTGGVRLADPATDLAVLAALMSAVHDRVVPPDTLFLGEVGLGGEVRPVAAVERRLAEAGRQGFHRAFLSARSRVRPAGIEGIEVVGLEGIGELGRRLAA